MTEDRYFAYRLADFGADFPADPVAAAQTATCLTVTLTRAAEAVQITLSRGDQALTLAAPIRVAGRDVAAGTPAVALWTLVDAARAVRLVAYRLGEAGPATAGATLVTSALPLKPGSSYDLSLTDAAQGTGPDLIGGFAQGTRLLTEAGKRPVEDIRAGDKVWTEGAGFQPVLWHGRQSLVARGLAAPVRLRRGLFGLTEDVQLAGAQGVRIDTRDGPALIPAAAFEAAGQASRDFGTTVIWHQILLADHAVIFAHGLPCESLWTGGGAWAGSDPGPGWPPDHRAPSAPVHPRLTVREALTHLA